MREVLHQYAKGLLTWREAAAALDVEDFSTFYALLTREGFALYEPDEAESQAKLAMLDSWMDEGL